MLPSLPKKTLKKVYVQNVIILAKNKTHVHLQCNTSAQFQIDWQKLITQTTLFGHGRWADGRTDALRGTSTYFALRITTSRQSTYVLHLKTSDNRKLVCCASAKLMRLVCGVPTTHALLKTSLKRPKTAGHLCIIKLLGCQ